MRIWLALLGVLGARVAAADDEVPRDRIQFAANMTVGQMFSLSHGDRVDTLGLVGYTIGATFPLARSLDLFVGLGFPIAPVGITLHLPVRLDWAPKGRHHNGLVVHTGVRPMYADMELCTYDLEACPQAFQDMVMMSRSYEHPAPNIWAVAVAGEAGLGYQWVWRHLALHTSLSYLGGYVHGVRGPFDPIAGYYQGFVVQLGAAGR